MRSVLTGMFLISKQPPPEKKKPGTFLNCYAGRLIVLCSLALQAGILEFLSFVYIPPDMGVSWYLGGLVSSQYQRVPVSLFCGVQIVDDQWSWAIILVGNKTTHQRSLYSKKLCIGMIFTPIAELQRWAVPVAIVDRKFIDRLNIPGRSRICSRWLRPIVEGH